MDLSPIDQLVESGKIDRAFYYLHKYEALHPDSPKVTLYLGNTYNRTNNWHEAERYYRKTIRLNPEDIVAYTHLESILRLQRRYHECRELLTSVERMSPGLSKVIDTSIAMLDLGDGNLGSGFRGFENRFEFSHMRLAYKEQWFPRWDGMKRIKGKRILIRYEQGLGDTIQYARYSDSLKSLGASQVDIFCKQALTRLLKCVPGMDSTYSERPPGPYDFEVMLMSLPALLGTSLESDIPGGTYIAVDPKDSALWANKIPNNGKLKVGLVWSGELKKGLKSWEAERMNTMRSIPLEQWRPILDVPCDYYSLQKGEKQHDLDDFSAVSPIIDLMNDVNDFYDTACIIDNLDMVIAVDTSTAHLSGALGKETWMLNRYDGCWRWMRDRSDTPWYDSMQIFNQTEFLEWYGPLNNVATQLQEVNNKKRAEARL